MFRSFCVAFVIASVTAFQCQNGFTNLDGQCVLYADYGKICATKANCNKWFGEGPQCEETGIPPRANCGWNYAAASAYCKSFGAGYGLVQIKNQYQNNAYNSLKGEGNWDLAWIGGSCKALPNSGGMKIAAWTWQADGSALLDGFTNFDWSVDPNTCAPDQCLVLGGTGYAGKWSGIPCTNHQADAICAENFNTDAPTPAPNKPVTCDKGWKLFPDPANPYPGRVGPTKCYQMLSAIKGTTREFSWNEASIECKAAGGKLAKIEDVQTNQFVASALGGSAYGLQWIGGKCVKQNGKWRFRWVKDQELVAAGYTNFPVDTFGMEQEINPCNAKSVDNPTGSNDVCLSLGGAGYNYQWRTGSCKGVLGDAICEKIPNGGSDDTPQPNGGKAKKSKGGAIAAGILVPILVLGGAFAGHKYMGGQGPSFSFGASPLGTKFISTSTYDPASDGTSFSTAQTAGGAASL